MEYESTLLVRIALLEASLNSARTELVQARAELERANAKLEAVRGAAKRWLGIADQHDRPDAPRVNLRDLPPSAGPLMNQTAAGCWRGCADEMLAFLEKP